MITSQAQRQLTKVFQEPQFSFLKKIAKKFPKSEVYLVGGAVRDAFLNTKTKDFDFIVRGVPARTLERFLKTLGRVDLVGKSFGVFKFLPNGGDEIIDIALPRTEHAILGMGGYKDFDVQSDHRLPIEKDLARRDFTVNAIAVRFQILDFPGLARAQPRAGRLQIIDPFDGLHDIQKKILRTVGKPQDRFREDSSRMLRAIRFACQLKFSVEKTTWNAIKKNIKRLDALHPKTKERIVPHELIGREIVKAFYFDPVQALDLLDESGALATVMPEVMVMKGCPQPQNWHTEGDVYVHSRMALQKLFSPAFKREFPKFRPNALVILGTFFHDLGKPYTIKTPEKDGTDRIRFHEHDTVGATIARTIAERLRFSQFPEKTPLHVNIDHLSWIIERHLLIIKEKLQQMKEATIEKYFFSDRVPGHHLIQVAWADAAATIHVGGKPDLSNHRYLKKRLRELAKLGKKKQLPAPLVRGNDVMQAFGLPAGPKIGELLTIAREAQLKRKIKTKEEALQLLTQQLTHDT